jgi:glycosyltransferase involved in cell wall biosynthesis
MPFFSIIIPTYNAASNIATALKSILHQTFTDFEILLMDGCSTDNTVEIANSCKDARIKICSEKDKGIYDAMNKGIEKAKGEWLYFLGSDDEVYNNAVLEKASYKINSYTNAPDLIYGNVWFKYAQQSYGGVFNTEKLLFENNICQQAIWYKKSLFNKVGTFNIKYKQLGDWDFNIRCFKNPLIHIEYIDEVIALYNERDGVSSTGYEIEFLREIPYHYKQQEKYIHELEDKIELITTSRSFKLANALLYPWRKIKSIFTLFFLVYK